MQDDRLLVICQLAVSTGNFGSEMLLCAAGVSMQTLQDLC